MAQNDNVQQKLIQQIAKQPFISDATVRDRFIEIAFKELVAKQIEDWKVNHEMAATLAVRYANQLMKERQNTEVLNVVVAKGSTNPAVTTSIVGNQEVVKLTPADTPPKSILEIIGDAPALQEVK